MGRGEEPKPRKLSSDEDMPDLNDPEVGEAAVKIQAAFKGYKTRKAVKPMKIGNVAGTVQAAVKIQRAYRRYKSRKMQNDLPDLNCSEVVNATVKIQSAYKGFRTRKEMKKKNIGQMKLFLLPSEFKEHLRN